MNVTIEQSQDRASNQGSSAAEEEELFHQKSETESVLKTIEEEEEASPADPTTSPVAPGNRFSPALIPTSMIMPC